jgi:serine protease Do
MDKRKDATHRRIALLGLAWFACIAAQPAAAGLPAEEIPNMVSRVMPSVVVVAAVTFGVDPHGDNQPPAIHHERGSGFVVDPAGFILTNRHVIEHANQITVTLMDGTVLPARLQGASLRVDVAMLKVDPPHPLPAVHFADSDRVRVGQAAIAIGNPLGLNYSVTAGIVSGVNRNIMESAFDDFIQTDAAINHGNSGGPLFDLQGRVVGMDSLIFAPGTYGGSIGLGFALPSNNLSFIADRLRHFGAVRPGYIGVRFQDTNERLNRSVGLPPDTVGAIIASEIPGSPGAQAGLMAADVVLRFGGQRVTDARSLARDIASATIGSKVVVDVWRDGHVRHIAVDIILNPDPAYSAPVVASNFAEQPVHGLGLTFAAPGAVSGTTDAKPAAQDGARVTDVTPGGPAFNAGIVAGDVITLADQVPVHSVSDIQRALASAHRVGRPFTPFLILQHDGSLRWVTLPSEPDGT